VVDGRDPELELARVFGEVARALLTDDDTETTLRHIMDLAVETVVACEYAGIYYVDKRRIRPGPVTDPAPSILDRIQADAGEGPCFDAIREHEVFRTGCLSDEHRWPTFAPRAHAESGIQSVVAVRLYAEEEGLGALNLYSTKVNAFDDRDVELASVFAVHAAVALARAREREQLKSMIASRQLIGEAVGIVMDQRHVTEDAAFDMLRAASQRLNRRVETIAEDVVRTGEVPSED
jgi:GAF domain-containing protein